MKEEKQIEAFVQAVNDSKMEQNETNKPLTQEEEEKKRNELINEAWKALDDKDKATISILIDMRSCAQKYVAFLSQKGKDWLSLVNL